MRPEDIQTPLSHPVASQPFAKVIVGSDNGAVTLTVATSNHRAMFCIDLSAADASAIAAALATHATIVQAQNASKGGKA